MGRNSCFDVCRIHHKVINQCPNGKSGSWWFSELSEHSSKHSPLPGSIPGNQKLIMTKKSYNWGVLNRSLPNTRERDTIRFTKATVNSSNCMFANTLYLLGGGEQSNPIITFLPSFCLTAFLSFWKGPFRGWGTILPRPERIQTSTSLRTGWPGLSLRNTISHGLSRPGLLHIQPLFDGQRCSPMTLSIHTIGPLPCKTAASSPALRHLALQPNRGTPL